MDPTLQAVLAASASFFLVTLIFTAIILACQTSNKRKENNNTSPSIRANNSRNPTRTRHLSHPEISSITPDESCSFEPHLKISMAELAAATKNFSPDLIIGDGSFGLVYKARLSNGVTVAIKKLDPDAFQGFREFRAEMETLGKLRHPNIVKILGYWASGRERLLVYEFIERGSLDYWLHNNDFAGQRSPLPWNTRVKIVKGVANGLYYLHHVLEKPIIHRDIKASNILLDSEFQAHIADFGLARRIDTSYSHVSTQVAGTIGYMPPEYREGVMVATMKADVYSFGMLMLETATGQRPNLPVTVDKMELGLVQWARKMMAQNAVLEMVDACIIREELSEESVKAYFRIARMCTSEAPKERPATAEIVELLKQIPS